ncbi:SH3 domain-containing protein 19-like isoform X2 [Electrophorus electricus]|uniref:SH3 domain-containing protein 19-like isoform X2 n=1 Tax=Electrophorus electricus TaxID=8005 RepID=UPI0015CFCEAB|nr:SH3 domain-containing protein 19-like isoform X2 [Electrophorus electricus]
MAEARIEDEEESMREARDRANASSERVERNKPEQRHSSSQGAFSSIRNAIKRTSTRSTSFRSSTQIDHNRDRRRPEITILSAEPLASNAWYPGTPAAPSAQPTWTSSILTVQLPPPSYEQVIREKSLEENISSSLPTPSAVSTSSAVPASSRPPSSSSSAPHPSTATIATQTDTDVPSPARVRTRRSVRRPPKPPPPALPLMPKPAPVHTRSLIDLDSPDSPCDTCSLLHTFSSEIPSGPLSEQRRARNDLSDSDVTVDLTRHSSAPTLCDSSPDSHDPPSQQKVSAHPRPHPRSKGGLQPVIIEDVLDQPMTREVKVQTLVRLKDDDTVHALAGFTDGSLEFASNKYLQELLDVFGYDEQCLQSNQNSESDQCGKSEEEEEDDDVSESFFISPHPSEPLERPKPKPRTKNPKLPGTPKPPSLTHGVPEAESPSKEKSKQGESEEEHKQEKSEEKLSPPVPAPRPVLNKTATSQQQQSTSEESSPQTGRLARPAGHPVAARRSKAAAQDEGALSGHPTAAVPPKASGSPVPTPRAAMVSPERGKGPLGPKQERPPFPAKPQSQKRPSSASRTSGRATVDKASPSFRLLPLRPPPIKLIKSAGSSQTNDTANQLPGSRVPKGGPPLPPRPKPGHPLYKDYTSKVQASANQNQTASKTVREEPPSQENLLVHTDNAHTPRQARSSREVKSRGGDLHEDACPAAPAEPTSQPRAKQELRGEQRTERKAKTVRQPEQELKGEQQEERRARLNVGDSCVAQFAFEGETDELTLHEGDVITLLERVNDEWGRGSLSGHTGLFPISFVQSIPEVSLSRKTTCESPAPAYVGGKQTGRAMYEFTPECEDELCLKVGDIVCSLESVDEQWFEGEFRGRRGIVPKSYIQVLKDPESLP